MKKIYSFNTELHKVTGIQRVMMDIHHAVKDDYESWIVGTMDYNKLNPNIGIERGCYIKFLNPFMFYHSIVIIHERKLLPVFWVLNHLLFQRIKLVYVHHNIFNDRRVLSMMPQTLVSISDKSTENLVNYFKVPVAHIHKILNCVPDIHPGLHRFNREGKITILYPARINYVKRQKDIYRQLKGRLDSKIIILFAGIGPDYQVLKEELSDEKQFKCLGFVENIPELLQQCDYMMLFSRKEGLPITLIEATMCSVPIICNNVGGNCEIAHDGENAFVTNDWEELITILNGLPVIEEKEYYRLSNNSRRIYENNFTFKIFKEKYLELLSTL